MAANQILLRYLNIGDHGVGSVLTADRSGNLFAVAQITDVSGVSKTRVIKTDSNGTQLASFDFGSSFPQAATADAQGNVILVGAISPSPVATAAAAFVMKLDSQLLGIVFSKLLGAPSWAYSVVLDAAGNIFVGGQTTAQNLPVTPGAFQSTPPVTTQFGGPAYGFLTELSPDGSNILYSTYFGGNNVNCGAGGGSDCI